MRLQFVGCGDAFGSGGQFNTCFHLVGRDINALIDCGATSLVSMNKLAIDRNAIRLILLTHFHADHVGGVPFFILEANYILKREQALDDRRTAEPQIALRGNHAGRLSRHAGTLELRFPLTLKELEIGRRNELGSIAGHPFPRPA